MTETAPAAIKHCPVCGRRMIREQSDDGTSRFRCGQCNLEIRTSTPKEAKESMHFPWRGQGWEVSRWSH